jgi:hypothetical protein
LLTEPKGTAFREIKGKLYPSVGMKKAGEHVRVNFGQSPFIFDIDGMMSASNYNFIDSHSVSPHIPFPGFAVSTGDLALDDTSNSQTSSSTTIDARPATANGNSRESAPTENNHPNGILARLRETHGAPSNEPSQEVIRWALNREFESDKDDPDLVGNIEFSEEHLESLSPTLHRMGQVYRNFNSATPERRRVISTMIRERLHNERLSRIFQISMSDDGALDLFRTVRTETLWQIILTTDLGEVVQSQSPSSVSDDEIPPLVETASTISESESPRTQPGSPFTGSTITVSDNSRETIRATRRALGIINSIPDTAANQEAQSRAIVLYNSPIITIRTSRFPNILANLREQQEKKHIRQEIEATRHAKPSPCFWV